MKPFPEQHELITLFHVEPALSDPGVPWVYNILTFTTVRGSNSVECTIDPGHGDLRVKWATDGVPLVDLNVQDVQGLRVDISSTRDALIADVSKSELILQLNPTIHVSWNKGQTTRPEAR